MPDNDKHIIIFPTKQYVRSAIADDLNRGMSMSDSSYIDIRNIPSTEIEKIISSGKKGFLPFFIKMSFKFKGVIKRIPILRNYARRVRDNMFQQAVTEKNNTQSALDLSGIINLKGDAFVTALYQAVLARDPDPAGWDSYMRFHASGASNEAMVYSICTSQEFLQRGLTVIDMDRYRKAYKSFNRKMMLKRIPIFYWLWWHIMLPRRISGYMAENYVRYSSLSRRIDQFISEDAYHHSLMLNYLNQFSSDNKELFWKLDQASIHYMQVEKELADEKLEIQKLYKLISNITEIVRENKNAGLSSDMESRLARLITINCEKSDSLANLISSAANKSKTAFYASPGGVIAVQVGDFIMGVPSEEWRFAMFLNNYGFFEYGTEKLFKAIIKNTDVVVDAGANLGIYTLHAAHAGCTVYSYEPTPSTYGLLKENVIANGFEVTGNVHTFNLAVAEIEKDASFAIESVSGHNSMYASNQARSMITVKAVALDNHLGDLDKIDIVKIDVEGAEALVLQGMRGIIKKNQQIKIFIEFGPSNIIRSGIQPSELIDMIRQLGLDIAMIDENTGKLTIVDEQDLIHVYSVNLLLAKHEIMLSLGQEFMQ